MKKILLLSILTICALQLFAKIPRNGYLTVGYINSELSKKGEDPINNRYGMSISAGYTHYFNKKPILNMLYLGVDWTFLHGNFRQYRVEIDDFVASDGLDNFKYKQDLSKKNEIDDTSIGMQFGPSITAMRLKDLQVSAYLRYSPTLDFIESAMDPYNPPTQLPLEYYQESVDYSYVGYYSVGLSVSYKIFMLGIEHSWGSMSHYVYAGTSKQNIKFDNKGTWFNIGIRLGKGGFGHKKKNYTYDNDLTQVY